MKTPIVVFLILLFSCSTKKKDFSYYKKQLEGVLHNDQLYRLDAAKWPIQYKLDAENITTVTKILDSVGWLGCNEIGCNANSALFLVIQHSNEYYMEKYLSIMKKAVKENKAHKEQLALLIDRVEMNNKRPQIYGSQVVMINNKYEIYNTIDIKKLDNRRKEMGLKPIEEYLIELNKMYK
jgi:hypothetical protein